MNIEGKVVTLRAIEMRDLDLLAEWSNSPEIWQGLTGWHFPYSKMSTEAYIKDINNSNMKAQNFAIETKEMGFIGTVSLANIDWKNRNAFKGLMLGNVESRGKGYALDTAMTIMRYAFKELGLNRIDGEMIEYHERSIDFFIRKCGWVVEGRRQNWFYRNGKYHDKVIVGITHEQYDSFMEKEDYWNI